MQSSKNWLKNTLSQLKNLDLQEHQAQVQVLDLLHQVERRKAYSRLGYDGLFSFCLRELRYTEVQAYSHIQAINAMKSVPEVKSKIEQGKMHLTTVARIQSFIKQEQVNAGIIRTKAEKLDLFTAFEDKTIEEVKAQLAELKGDRMRVRLTVELDEEAEVLWQKVKTLTAHQNQGSHLRLLKSLMQNYLAQNVVSKESRKPARTTGEAHVISAETRRQVLERDHHQCVNCGSRKALQIEHIIPKAVGGTNVPENLHTLCRNCNLRAVGEMFGLERVRLN